MYTWVSWIIIGIDNDLLPIQLKGIIGTNANVSSIIPAKQVLMFKWKKKDIHMLKLCRHIVHEELS